MALIGLGLAGTVSPLTATVLGCVDETDTGIASGINNAVARVAGLLAIAVLGIVASGSFDRALDRHLAQAQLSAVAQRIPPAERHKLGAAQPPSGLPPAQTQQVRRAISESLLSTFRLSMAIGAGLSILAGATAALTLASAKARSGRASRKKTAR